MESNPEVFTQFIQKLGVPSKWQVSECYGLDEELLEWIPQPVLAVIVAVEKLKYSEPYEYGDPEVPTNFYMKQTPALDYACGVIACIHAVLNNLDHIDLDKDSVLDAFYRDCKNMTPLDKALSLEGNRDF